MLRRKPFDSGSTGEFSNLLFCGGGENLQKKEFLHIPVCVATARSSHASNWLWDLLLDWKSRAIAWCKMEMEMNRRDGIMVGMGPTPTTPQARWATRLQVQTLLSSIHPHSYSPT
ncbi:hypothetical protein CEXT_480291 [Caerostris extrusa]|uniref:Uncharacterized protein n=1 Tax=Caerostris extrusa TaxID=172846 RepID=A0AAV4XHT8_CAEEX|nr:hypothetical protein CEXT_480291 [Caerostris extrusa]